jgi:N-acetyl-alpha-D-muramate 1-phosphate uridylyltransferase
VSVDDLAAVVLAAGRGQRLRPLTDLSPKPLCPVANRALVDLALDRVEPFTGTGPDAVAVNAHYRADAVARHVDGRAIVSIEQPVALGTAGALGRLRSWIAGRPVLVTNSDAYLPEGLAELVEGWDGRRIRLLGKDIGGPSDFGRVRYVGACLLPWPAVEQLDPEPTGLYERLWRAAAERGELDLVTTEQTAIDCGTPQDYLRANLVASHGESSIGDGAVVEGRVERCVVWPGAHVGSDEHLVEAIRAGTAEQPVTVPAAQSARKPHGGGSLS